MTHTILHVGDLHLCSSHPRNGDRLEAFDQIVAHAEACDTLAATVIPGDLFHQKPTTQDRNDLAPRLIALANRAPVLMVYGNHDEAGSLDIFQRLEAQFRIVVASEPRVYRDWTLGGLGIACFAMPWPHKAGLVAMGTAHGAIGQDARTLLDPVFLAGATELESDPDALPIVIGHATIGGAVASTGQPQIGMSGIDVDAALLARFGRGVYLGFNHIHKHQTIHGAVYAGSVARLDFAEREPKGFVEVEYQRDGNRWEYRWRFVPLDVPAMLHVEGRLHRDGFAFVAVDGETTDGIAEDVIRGADVKVTYRFNKAEVGALDVAHIHATFAGCRSLKLDPIAEVEHTVRAPEIAAAATLDEKVLRYAERQQIPVTTGLRTKLTALQALEAEQVLSQVATQCAEAGAASAVTPAEAGAF